MASAGRAYGKTRWEQLGGGNCGSASGAAAFPGQGTLLLKFESIQDCIKGIPGGGARMCEVAVMSRGRDNRKAGRGGSREVVAGWAAAADFDHDSVGELLSLKQGRDMSRSAFQKSYLSAV